MTRQRVCAALGPGAASTRSSSSGTPDFSAASASRRLAVRSSSRIAPHPSTITAPNAAQRNASTAVRNSATPSGTTPTRPFPAAANSFSPLACTTPPARAPRSERTHNTAFPGAIPPAIPLATAPTNPAAAARSTASAA